LPFFLTAAFFSPFFPLIIAAFWPFLLAKSIPLKAGSGNQKSLIKPLSPISGLKKKGY